MLPYIGPEFIAHLLKWDQIDMQVVQEHLALALTSATYSSVLVGPESQSADHNTSNQYKEPSRAFKAAQSMFINWLLTFFLRAG